MWNDPCVPCVSSNVSLVLLGPDGLVKDRRDVHNVVTANGLAGIADHLLAALTISRPSYMELGTGVDATTVGTTLSAYIADSRTALHPAISRSGAVVTLPCTFVGGTGTGNVTEAGIFPIVTQNTGAGTYAMYCYAHFDQIAKSATDTLAVSWTFTFANA